MLPSLLQRSVAPLESSSVQVEVDRLVGGFVDHATDFSFLAAMTTGGLAYRTARIGVMGLGSGNVIRAASIVLGLTAEVSTFELTHRSLQSVGARFLRPQWAGAHMGAPLHPENHNLWRLEGPGGLAQGLLHSFINFGILKGAGHWARGENLVARHLLQDASLVAGHQISAQWGLAERPRGSLAEQFLQAEAMNWQMEAGMALAFRLAPSYYGAERGLDLFLRGKNTPRLRRDFPENTVGFSSLPLAMEGLPSPRSLSSEPSPSSGILLSKMLSEPPPASETHPTDRGDTREFFADKIRTEIESLHRRPDSSLELLENYLRRLRILRLCASLRTGVAPTVMYPMAGVDVVPSLFFPKIIGIDPWVDFPHAPSDPEYFRDQGLVVGGRHLNGKREGFEKRLEEIYEAAARSPERHLALGRDAFDPELTLNLKESTPGPRLVFLKGTPYLDLFYSFSEPRQRSPLNLRSMEEAALWLADHYSAPNDGIILWDGHEGIRERLLQSGRYEKFDWDFLQSSEQTLLTGSPQWVDVRVEPILNPSAGLNLRLTDSMEVLKRIR